MFFVVVLGLLFLTLPFVALFVAFEARSEARRLADELAREKVAWRKRSLNLETESRLVAHRLDALLAGVPLSSEPSALEATTAPAIEQPSVAPPPERPVEPEVEVEAPPVAPQPQARPVEAPSPVLPFPGRAARDTAASENDLERFLGAKAATWVGVITLLFAVGYFVKWSIENNLVGPLGRVVSGLVVGLAMLASGLLLRRRPKYAVLADGLAGGGLGVLYLSIFAAQQLYGLVGQATAFLGMAAVTALGVLVAVVTKRQSTAVLALLGGLLTPPLVSEQAVREPELLIYLIVLNALVVAASWARRWPGLTRLAFVGTSALTFGACLVANPQPERPGFRLALTGVLWAMFAVAPFLGTWRRRVAAAPLDALTAAANPFAYFAIVFATLEVTAPNAEVWWAATLAAVYGAAAVLVRRRVASDVLTFTLHAAVGLAFLVLVPPLAFDGETTTLAWALVATVLAAAAARAKAANLLLWIGVGACAGLTALRIAVFDVRFGMPEPAVWNATFLVHLLSTVAIGGAAFAAWSETKVRATAYPRALASLAILLMTMLLYREPVGAWPAASLVVFAVALAAVGARFGSRFLAVAGHLVAAVGATAILTVDRELIDASFASRFHLIFWARVSTAVGAAVPVLIAARTAAKPPPTITILSGGAAFVAYATVAWYEPTGLWPALLLGTLVAAIAASTRVLERRRLAAALIAAAVLVFARLMVADAAMAATSWSTPWHKVFWIRIALAALLPTGALWMRGDTFVHASARVLVGALGALAMTAIVWSEPLGLWPAILIVGGFAGVVVLCHRRCEAAIAPVVILLAAALAALRLFVTDDGLAFAHGVEFLNGPFGLRLALVAILARAAFVGDNAVWRRALLCSAWFLLLIALSQSFVFHSIDPDLRAQGIRHVAELRATGIAAAVRAAKRISAGFTVLWSVYAAATLAFGFWKKSDFARWGALACFGVVLVKVYFVDLADLPTILRVGSLAVLGLILLGVAYLYQRLPQKAAGERA